MAIKLVQKKQERKRIGEVLIEMGFITSTQIEKALKESAETRQRLGEVLIQNQYVTEVQMAEALACQFDMDFLDLEAVTPTDEALKCLPEAIVRQLNVLPIKIKDGVLILSVADPLNVLNIDSAEKILKIDFVVKVSPEGQLKELIERSYAKGQIAQLARRFAARTNQPTNTENVRRIADPPRREGAQSIETVINGIINHAIVHRASDIHVEPDDTGVRVRQRVDGILQQTDFFPLEIYSALISRLKILGDLDIAEKRQAQDGRFQVHFSGRDVDLRLSTLPTVRGEKAVIRLLDKSALRATVDSLGLEASMSTKLQKILDNPHGIILVTGPTGSGKSTTVYSMLSRLNSIDKNIITIEDPVEYNLELINQVQINPKAGLTFASVLRNILRQDPDVIMVGEIRDRETAEIAVRAALTGHLVISTIHTNDSISTIDRLIEMGLEPFLLSSSLLGIIAQRLVRVLCENCKEETSLTNEQLRELGASSAVLNESSKVYKPVGCIKCLNTGYRGRHGVFELFAPKGDARKAIAGNSHSDELTRLAETDGFKNMRHDGIRLLLEGVTSADEVLRATLYEE